MGASPLIQPLPWNGRTYDPPQPNDIMAAESGIVSVLKLELPKRFGVFCDISHFPNDYQNYRLQHQIGAVLVRYVADSFSELRAVDIVNQDREMNWGLAILSRDLGWNYGTAPSANRPGIYGIVEAVRLTLSGVKLPNFTKLHPRSTRFVGYRDGVWGYEMIFAHKTGAKQLNEAPNYPLFTHGYFEERGGITDIPIAAENLTFDVSGNINLGQQNITSIAMTDVLNTVTYIEGRDFKLDSLQGIASVLAGGSLSAGMTVKVAFSYAELVQAVSGGGSAPLSPTN